MSSFGPAEFFEKISKKRPIYKRYYSRWLWTTVFPVLSYTFATFWVLPFFLLSKFVNAIWFADIADTAYRNAGPAERPRMMNTVSVAIADTVFTIIIETIFLFQAKVMGWVFSSSSRIVINSYFSGILFDPYPIYVAR